MDSGSFLSGYNHDVPNQPTHLECKEGELDFEFQWTKKKCEWNNFLSGNITDGKADEIVTKQKQKQIDHKLHLNNILSPYVMHAVFPANVYLREMCNYHQQCKHWESGQ